MKPALFLSLTAAIVLTPAVSMAQTSSPTTSETKPPETTATTTVTTILTESPTVDPRLEQRLRAWNKSLRQIARLEKATLFCDVDLASDPPGMSYGGKRRGADAMQALARALTLSWHEVQGVQAFSRTMNQSSVDVAGAVDWALSLSDTDRKRLLQGEMKVSETDPKMQERLLRLLCWEPDNSFAIMEQSSDPGLRLTIAAGIEYIDPQTGKRVQRLLGGQRFSPKFSPKSSPSPLIGEPRYLPIGRPQPGLLDFGEGDVLKLSDIVGKAQDAFNIRYSVDPRIAENRYFVNGQMNRSTFEAVMDQVTTVPPVRLKPNVRVQPGQVEALLRSLNTKGAIIEVTGLRDRLPVSNSAELSAVNDRFGPNEQISVEDCLNRKTYSVAQLSEGKPGITTLLSQLGLPPDIQVTLTATPVLTIATEGMHEVSHGSAMIGGKPVPLMAPNMTTIQLR